jgi:hypothetical protein
LAFIQTKTDPSGEYQGSNARLHQIDVSTSLIDWSPWVGLLNSDGIMEVIDLEAPNYSRRFYRGLVP